MSEMSTFEIVSTGVQQHVESDLVVVVIACRYFNHIHLWFVSVSRDLF